MNKLLIIFVSVVLTACGTVPRSSAIREGSILGSISEGSIVRVIASNPQSGMTPEEIVSGFLNASASIDNDFRIAREYLVPEIKNTWLPNEKIQVYDGQGRLNSLQTDTIIFSAPLTSVIDSQSRLVLAEPDAEVIQEFKLRQVDNEWRIDLKDNGLLISQADLTRSFTSYPLWFPDTSLRTLVPDSVVLPKTTSSSSTRLMQLLLAGPGDYLTGAVRTAFPIGTTLALNSVPVNSALATVSLNDSVLSAEPFLREVLSAQIVKTLLRIPELGTVRINVGNQSLVVPNTPIRQTTSLWDKFRADFTRTSDALAIQEGKIVRIDSERITPLNNQFFTNQNWFAAVENRSGNILAAVSADRNQLLVQDNTTGNSQNVIVEGQSLRSPHSDIFDSIWVTGVNQVSVVSNKRVIGVGIEEADKQNVIDVIPAPDGVRALLITSTVYGTELRFGTIVREDENIKINYLRKVIRDGFSVKQAIWQDESSILYLEDSGDIANIYSLDLFTGVSKLLHSQLGATNIASSAAKPLLVSLEDGSMIERISGDWVNRGELLNASYPG